MIVGMAPRSAIWLVVPGVGVIGLSACAATSARADSASSCSASWTSHLAATGWETGAIHTQQDAVNPKQWFDSTAEGWQTSRIPK